MLIKATNKNKIQNIVTTTTNITTTTVAPTTTTTTTTIVSSPPTTVVDNSPIVDPTLGVTQQDVDAWSKVAVCEEGGDWTVQGSVYSGGLGMLNSTWAAYGGLQYAPNAGQASIAQQIAVAKKIQSTPPDQSGCSGSW